MRESQYRKKVREYLESKGYTLLRCFSQDGLDTIYKDHDYIASITINSWSKKVIFNNKKYTDIDMLLYDIAEYNKTLEFDVNTYNPDYNPEFVKKDRLRRLIEDFGYKSKAYFDNSTLFEFLNKQFGMTLGKICDDGSYYVGDYSWIQIFDKQDDILKIKQDLYAMMKTITICNIAYLVNILNIIGGVDCMKDIKIKSLNTHTLETIEYDASNDVIRILEETLNKLKQK